MSKSPSATKPYLKNKGSPLNTYNRAQEVLVYNTQSIGHTKNIHSTFEIKTNQSSKLHYINYHQVPQHNRSKAQSNNLSCTFRYEPSQSGIKFYPLRLKKEDTKKQSQNIFPKNSDHYANSVRNRRLSSDINDKQFAYQKNLKNIALKTQQNQITDKLMSLEDKISKMKATLDQKKSYYQSFVKAVDKNDNKHKRENSQIERNQNNSLKKQIKSIKKRKKNHTQGVQLLLPSNDYLKTSELKNSPTYKKYENKQIHSNMDQIITRVSNEKHCHATKKNPYPTKQNWIYYISQIVKAYKDKQSLAIEHVQSSLGILRFFKAFKIPSYQSISEKSIYLIKPLGYQKKKTIIFDLDETLVHCNETSDLPYHHKIPIKLPNGEATNANINIRPYAKQILKNLHPYFEIIIFTASHSCYANAVIDLLDPQKRYIHHRLFREQCFKSSEGMYVKDLRVINRQISQIVLVDNAAYSFAYQIDNGIPIIPYYQGEQDFELQALQTYLYKILNVQDVRELNRKTFKLSYYPNYTDAETLIKQLYIKNVQ